MVKSLGKELCSVLLLVIASTVSLQSHGQLVNASLLPADIAVDPGDSFTIEVFLEPDQADFTVAQVALSFDPSIMAVNSINLSPNSLMTVPLPGTVVYNTNGFLFYAAFSFVNVSTSFTHLEINCTAGSEGITNVEFVTTGVQNTLFAFEGDDIAGVLTPCVVTVGTPFDCPGLQLNIGDPCDDGDPSTENDVVGPDCLCEGEPVCSNPFPLVDPMSMSEEFLTNGKVRFTWDAPIEALGCRIQGKPAGGGPLQVRTLIGGNFSQFTAPSNFFSPGLAYQWRVACGCSLNPLVAGNYTPYRFFIYPGSVIEVSPNPSNGPTNVNFQVSQDGKTTLEIIDLTGRIVDVLFAGDLTANESRNIAYDTSHLRNGVYLYRLTTDQEIIQEKFVKSN